MNIPFSKYYGIKDLVMDKRRAIQIMTKAADIYRGSESIVFVWSAFRSEKAVADRGKDFVSHTGL